MILELIIILAALVLLAVIILLKLETDMSKQSNKDLFNNIKDRDNE